MMSRVPVYVRLVMVAVLGAISVGSAAFAQTDINDALKKAIRFGDLDKVKALVAKGADLNYMGALPLYEAANQNQLEIAKFLVGAGANVNGVMTYGQVAIPLRAAASRAQYQKDSYRMVDYLLGVGADPAAGGIRQYTPLTAAVMTARLDQVKKIVGRGNVDLEFKEWFAKPGDGLGRTALMIAAERGFGDIVEYLVAQGANVNTSRDCGRTALNYAAAKGSAPLVRFLLGKGAEVNPKVPELCNNRAPLLDATDISVIRLLLEAGADPNAQRNSAHDWTRRIYFAVEKCNSKLIDLLVKHGARYEDELKQTYKDKCT